METFACGSTAGMGGMDKEKPQGVYLGCVLLIRRVWEKYNGEKGDFMKIIAKCGCFSQFSLPYK